MKNEDTNIKPNENLNEKKIENHEDAVIIYKDDNDNYINEEKKDENNDNNNNKKNIFLNEKKNKIKETKKIIQKEKSIIFSNKEEIENKIIQLQNEYMLLKHKTLSELLEELYLYLEIDDYELYRKKMIGYLQPFSVRGKDNRFVNKPEKYNFKCDAKNARDMYDLLMKRQEDLKKEMELKKMKEKDLEYEKRKKNFMKN